MNKKEAAFVAIVGDILNATKWCNTISFSHVKQSGNTVAHNLARVSKSFDELRVWMEQDNMTRM